MADHSTSLGIAPDGKPFAVHATAAPFYGRGALIGLVAGARAGTGAAPVVALLTSLVESLMQRGMLSLDDVAKRWRMGGHTRPPADMLPLLVIPVALFHAGQHDELEQGVMTLAAHVGSEGRVTIASLAVAHAISAGTFDMVHAREMTVAAVHAIDAAGQAGIGTIPKYGTSLPGGFGGIVRFAGIISLSSSSVFSIVFSIMIWFIVF